MITRYVLIAAVLIGLIITLPDLWHAWKLYRADTVDGSKRILRNYILHSLLAGFPDLFWAAILYAPFLVGETVFDYPWLVALLAAIYLFFRGWGALSGREQLRSLTEYQE